MGTCSTVYPGSLIGRLVTADLSISDPRVSEAHALVSLRDRSLKLLALRGPLLIDGSEVDAVELRPGMSIGLADGLSMTVESVEMPTHALMLCGAAPGAVELRAAVYSLLSEPGDGTPMVRLVLGFVESAVGHVWHSGARQWIRLAGGPAQPLTAGSRWTVEECPLRVIRVPLGETSDTWGEHVRSKGGLVLYARYTTVHVQRSSGTAVLTGKPANLVSELIRFGSKPVPWDVVSQQIWGADVERALLRKSFDSTMRRLRTQLQEFDLREDLVGLDGSGNIELVLHAGDRVVDET